MHQSGVCNNIMGVAQTVNPRISKQIKCISQNFGSPSILLVASSGGADWWYVTVTPRSTIKAYRISRFAHGRPP